MNIIGVINYSGQPKVFLYLKSGVISIQLRSVCEDLISERIQIIQLAREPRHDVGIAYITVGC